MICDANDDESKSEIDRWIGELLANRRNHKHISLIPNY